MGKAHQAIAGQMKNELEEPLAAFGGGMKERRKIVQTGIEKLFKIKQQQTQLVNKVGSSRPGYPKRDRLMKCRPETDMNRTA